MRSSASLLGRLLLGIVAALLEIHSKILRKIYNLNNLRKLNSISGELLIVN